MKIMVRKNIINIVEEDWFKFHELVLRFMENKINFTATVDYKINIFNIGIKRIKNIIKGLD